MTDVSKAARLMGRESRGPSEVGQKELSAGCGTLCVLGLLALFVNMYCNLTLALGDEHS